MASHSWKNKRVLVTGADGFMGSHLTDRLLGYGAHVSIFVRGNSVNGTVKYSLRNLKGREKKFKAILTGDLASHDSIALIKDNAPEYIFHLAADAYVPNSFDHPREVMESNFTGTVNMLDAAREMPKLKRLVCTSSSEIYGTAQYAPIDEDHPLNPSSPYAASKVAADRTAYSYWNTYGTPISIIRPFNTFGPRHTYDVIPKFITLAMAGKPLTVHGDGLQTRDFTYVDDMIDAFLVMGHHPKAVGQAVNFGTGRDETIKKTAQLILKALNSKSPIVHTGDRQSQVKRLICDWSLAKKLFGWRPRVRFEEGVRRNVEWALQNRA